MIPLIAALLAMGVPLSAVMAFWLASSIMDPSIFVLTAGVLDLEFAVAKSFAAIGLPQHDSPTMPSTSPRRNARSTSLTARIW